MEFFLNQVNKKDTHVIEYTVRNPDSDFSEDPLPVTFEAALTTSFNSSS